MRFGLILLIVFLLPFTLLAQTSSEAQLKKALAECEQDLDASLSQIEALKNALNATNSLIDKRAAIADSLIKNLQNQLRLQSQIGKRLQMNADTLQIMVKDYDRKLNEIADLYRKELQRSSRPWFFTLHGWQGFGTGVLIGGAIGVVFSVVH